MLKYWNHSFSIDGSIGTERELVIMFRGPRTIFKRDFIKFLNSPFIIFSSLLIPVMYLVVFGSALGGTSPISRSGSSRKSRRMPTRRFLPMLHISSIISVRVARMTPKNSLTLRFTRTKHRLYRISKTGRLLPLLYFPRQCQMITQSEFMKTARILLRLP